MLFINISIRCDKYINELERSKKIQHYWPLVLKNKGVSGLSCLKVPVHEVRSTLVRLTVRLQLHLSQDHSVDQECDLPHVSQGSNEPHIVPRLGTCRSSCVLLALRPAAALQRYHVTPERWSKPCWFYLEPCFIILNLSLPCLPVAVFSFHMPRI